MSDNKRPRSRSEGSSGGEGRPRKDSRPRRERPSGTAEQTGGARQGSGRQGTGPRGPGRSNEPWSPSDRSAANRTTSAEELLEMADEIEEHARGLLAQARALQRMAERLSGSGSASGERTRRPPAGRGGAGGTRERSGERTGEQPRSRRGGAEESPSEPRKGGSRRGENAPSWTPPPRKRRP